MEEKKEKVDPFSIINYDLFAVRGINGWGIVLYGILKSLAKKQGYCFATNKYILQLMSYSISERQLDRYIKKLEELGLIRKESHQFNKGGFQTDRKIFVMEPPKRSNLAVDISSNTVLDSFGTPPKTDDKIGNAVTDKIGIAVDKIGKGIPDKIGNAVPDKSVRYNISNTSLIDKELISLTDKEIWSREILIQVLDSEDYDLVKNHYPNQLKNLEKIITGNYTPIQKNRLMYSLIMYKEKFTNHRGGYIVHFNYSEIDDDFQYMSKKTTAW